MKRSYWSTFKPSTQWIINRLLAGQILLRRPGFILIDLLPLVWWSHPLESPAQAEPSSSPIRKQVPIAAVQLMG